LIDAQDLDFLDVNLESKPNTSPLRPSNLIPSVEVKKPPPPLPPRRSDSDVLPNVSLLVDSLTVKHSYPPVRSGSETGHVPSSSISSFHSVSLSSDSGNRDSMNLDESLELLSIPAILDGPESQTKANGSAPKLPPRPSSTPVAPVSLLAKRRPPPPPPPTFPKRETSLATNSSTGLGAWGPTAAIDVNARNRYGSLFDRNLELQNQCRTSATQQKGWRGTSAVFLKSSSPASPSTRLDGYIVKAIWECSQLNKYQLRRIW
jgi:hypothetical protein